MFVLLLSTFVCDQPTELILGLFVSYYPFSPLICPHIHQNFLRFTPPGTFTRDNATASYCTTCPRGYECKKGQVEPIPCQKGYYSDEGAESCLKCAYGRFTDEEAQFECKYCELVGTMLFCVIQSLGRCSHLTPYMAP